METLLTFLQKKYINQLDCNLRFLLKKYSIEEIVKEIVGWLKIDKLDYFDITTFARDFYIGSDLTQEEKEHFHDELKRQGFFQQLNDFLYHDDYAVCSWTIYTFGTFSNNENVGFLETAYEKHYRLTNPILSYRCLLELSWLNSNKVDDYLQELELDNSISSILILLYYWEKHSSHCVKFNELLTDKEVRSLVLPYQMFDEKEKDVSIRLFAFENHLSELHNLNRKKMDKNEFESVAKSYFKNFVEEFDIEGEKQHQEFLKRLGED